MANRSLSSFTIKDWDEKANDAWRSGKVTRTLATKVFTGSLEGSSEIEAIMLRMDNDQSKVMAYVGIERIDCVLDNRSGSFVLVHMAEALDDDRQAVWKILAGSGTGELAGITGQGTILPNHDFVLEYELPDSQA